MKRFKTRKRRWSLVRNRFLLGSSSEAIVKFDRIDGFPQTGCGPGEHCLLRRFVARVPGLVSVLSSLTPVERVRVCCWPHVVMDQKRRRP